MSWMERPTLIRTLIVSSLIVFPLLARAEWELISDRNDLELVHYVDLQTTKQSGPMAIYRQVQVLSQGPAVTHGALSTQALYEYDCMNAKVRILKISGFSEQWARGESIAVTPPSSLGQWLALPGSPLGQKTLIMLCPGSGTN